MTSGNLDIRDCRRPSDCIDHRADERWEIVTRLIQFSDWLNFQNYQDHDNDRFDGLAC